MDFRKRLKMRLYVAAAYILLGAAMIAAAFSVKTDNGFLSSFGLALAVIGIAKVRNYFIITRNDESVRKREIAETDERNIAICAKAKSAAFTVYAFAAGVGVIVLEILNKVYVANVIAVSVCALIVIYWVCYGIVSRKF